MATTYTLIDKTILTGTQASVTFNSISSAYTDLKVVVSARGTEGSDSGLLISFNGTSTNYSHIYLLGAGSGTPASGTNAYGIGSSSIYVGTSNGSSSTSSTFSSHDIYIPNYLSSNYKSISSDSTSENNATAAYAVLVAGLWSNNAAISSLTLAYNAGSFVSGSSFYLYGIKNS